MRVSQTNKFAKTVKKLTEAEHQLLMSEVTKVVRDPRISVQKNGVLKRVRVYKFRYETKQKLLAYILSKGEITFVAYGAHENFYRDIS